MEIQLLAIGYESYSNYIKLPDNILAQLNQPINSNDSNDFNNKTKGLTWKEHFDLINEPLIKPPYYFLIESQLGLVTYCGVIDFTADENCVVIPNYIMNQLQIFGSDFVTIRYVQDIPKGTFVQIEPQEIEIFTIPDLDKFLELEFSKYCILYTNQILELNYDTAIYHILIKEVKSDMENTTIIDIVNTDIKIDIFNKFYEAELKEQIRREEDNKRKEEMKRKEEIKYKEDQQKKDIFSGTGFKIGGTNITDTHLLREYRLQKFIKMTETNQLDINNKPNQKIEKLDEKIDKPKKKKITDLEI